MGDANQRLFLERHVPRVDGPVVEIGSKDYGSTASFRDLYRGVDYVGADLEAGKGVDVVVDLTKGLGGLEEHRFALAICCSVLEHTPEPWVMAGNITRLLRPDGVLYLSVPWVWRYHAYPDDYFRFSPRAVQSLFPALQWTHAAYSTNVAGEMVPLELGDFREVDNRMAALVDTPQGQRKYLPYLMVNMLGRRSVERG
ncbi:MAG: class I SAM-dependent methyltransferase [Burkholderiales bacterium]